MNLKPNIVFTSPVLNHPALGGPELRIENSIIALSKVSNVHLLIQKSWMELHSLNWGDFKSNDDVFKFYLSFLNSVKFTRGKNKILSIVDSISKGSDLVINWKSNFILIKFINLIFRYFANLLIKLIPKISLAKDVVNLARKTNSQIIWFGYGNISYDLMLEVKRLNPSLKLVCDTDSVWSRFILRELPFAKNENRRKEILDFGKRKEKEEQEFVKLCDVTTAVSDVDKDYYQNLNTDNKRVMLFSNVINLDSYPTCTKAKLGNNIFLGGSFFANSPMEQASRWLINEVLPLVKLEVSDAHLHVVGRGSKTYLDNISRSDITVHGTVNSILPIVRSCKICLVPLFFESGTRFKILEAGACRKPVISTTLGAEGLDVNNEEHILIADEPKDFANAIIRLLTEPLLARMLSDNLYQLVAKNYCLSSLEEEGKAILNFLNIE